jgi:hypothetical protein
MTDAIYGRKSGKWTAITNRGIAKSTNSRVRQMFLAIDHGHDNRSAGTTPAASSLTS